MYSNGDKCSHMDVRLVLDLGIPLIYVYNYTSINEPVGGTHWCGGWDSQVPPCLAVNLDLAPGQGDPQYSVRHAAPWSLNYRTALLIWLNYR